LKIIFYNKNQGKCAALATGINNANGIINIIQDANSEYDPNEYPSMIGPIKDAKADIVYGSRF
tara:strand:- start:344 stop:532 length:189 start_codon:yes stop_codon:yes gene_type:complete